MTKNILLAVIAISLGSTGAMAKGHDQGQTEDPGALVGKETVAAAQTLGGAKGKRPVDKGPTKSDASEKAGR